MRFGRWDFAAFMAECPAEELNGWQSFQEQDPVGWQPEWEMFARLMSWMAATHPFSPRDIRPQAFLPGPPAAGDGPLTADEKAARVRGGGGVVRQSPPLIRAKPKGE